MEWVDANRWQLSLLGQMNGVAWVLDPAGKTLFVNRRVLESTGRREEDVVGHDWFDTMVPEDIREPLRERYLRAATSGTGAPTPVDSELLTVTGERRGVRVFHSIVRDEQGAVQAIALAGEDTTEQRQAQAAREADGALYRTLAEASQDMVFIIDPDDRVTYVNTNAANHLGRNAENIVGQPRSTFFPDSNAQRQLRAIRKVLETGETLRSETQDTIGGRTVWLDTHLVPLRGQDGQVNAVMGVARDITDRKRAEDAERLAALGQLAAGVGHEFNNILAGLALAAEVACEDNPGTACEELARYVERATVQGAHICSQLATFARPSPPRRGACTIEEALEAALGVVRNQLGQSGISVVREYATDGWTSEADRAQMQQVFLNLLINAAHAMPTGGKLTLRTWHTTSPDGPGEVVASVSDTGTGIAPEHLGRVFEPFYTTKGAFSDHDQPGTGLGLSVSHSIVLNHGGLIEVHSEPGEGATFTVSLPAQAQNKSSEGRPSGTTVPSPLPGTRVLVAEDGSDLRHYVTSALVAAGYEVVPVSGTAEALAALREERFDAVLTDLLMPGGGGHAVIELARQCAPRPRVVAMSGRVSEETEREVLMAGAHGFLRKPFSRVSLLGAIAEAVESRPAPPDGAPNTSP